MKPSSECIFDTYDWRYLKFCDCYLPADAPKRYSYMKVWKDRQAGQNNCDRWLFLHKDCRSVYLYSTTWYWLGRPIWTWQDLNEYIVHIDLYNYQVNHGQSVSATRTYPLLQKKHENLTWKPKYRRRWQILPWSSPHLQHRHISLSGLWRCFLRIPITEWHRWGYSSKRIGQTGCKWPSYCLDHSVFAVLQNLN